MEKSQERNRRSRCICRYDNIYREVFAILLELSHSYTYGVSKPYTTENFSILKLNFLDFCKSESNRISYLYFKTMCKIVKKLRTSNIVFERTIFHDARLVDQNGSVLLTIIS